MTTYIKLMIVIPLFVSIWPAVCLVKPEGLKEKVKVFIELYAVSAAVVASICAIDHSL